MGSYKSLSSRSKETDFPVMVQLEKLKESVKDAMPLGQGAVYWKPPEETVEKAKEVAWEICTSRYGSHEGLPQLREALINKLKKENKLLKSDVTVTSGSNQGFLNLVLTLCDTVDSVILFAPYFFNAYQTFKMTGINNILVGPSDQTTFLPDTDWLEKTLSEVKPVPKLVSIVNPGNPTGIVIPEPQLKRISDICYRAGTWLVVDNAYEYFTYDGFEHSCVEGNHVINLFTFSKAYGIMGWRVGYMAYSPEAHGLKEQLLKAQDNVMICTPMISQHLAFYCLHHGREWVQTQVKTLVKNKELLMRALLPLGKGAVIGGQGSACGMKGYVRVTYGMVRDSECELAAKRLKRGVEELIQDGLVD